MTDTIGDRFIMALGENTLGLKTLPVSLRRAKDIKERTALLGMLESNIDLAAINLEAIEAQGLDDNTPLIEFNSTIKQTTAGLIETQHINLDKFKQYLDKRISKGELKPKCTNYVDLYAQYLDSEETQRNLMERGYFFVSFLKEIITFMLNEG